MQTKLDELKATMPHMQSLETENQLLQKKLEELENKVETLEADKVKAEGFGKFMLKGMRNRMNARAHGDSAQRVCKLCYHEMVGIKEKGQEGDEEIIEYVEELREKKVIDIGVQTTRAEDGGFGSC